MHAVYSLGGRQFTAFAAWHIGVELEHGLLLDHDPSNPRIGHCEQKEQSNHGTGAEVEKLDAQGEGKEDTGRENVDGPLQAHGEGFACR